MIQLPREAALLQSMRFFSLWAGLNPWFRYGTALLLMGISTVIYFAGAIWIWGWVSGFIVLTMAGRYRSEKSGYHF